jgi:hypothetical protein
MGVTESSTTTLTGRDEKIRQIERLVHSSLLHGSESLCKLLRYLADQDSIHPGTSAKEYQIATEVFGRPPNFDPRLDSTVRVQTGRLRSKLAEYYAQEGASDNLIVELPRGSYSLTFRHRAPLEGKATPALPHSDQPVLAPVRSRRRDHWLVFLVAATTLALISVAVLGYVLAHQTTAADQPSGRNVSGELRSFWRNFLEAPEAPLVVYSNAEFVGRPETGMRYFRSAQDARDQILDHYTGVGEVMAIHELEHLFAGSPHGLRVKRGRLLSLDDAKNGNLVFIGSPSENLSLRELPGTQCFQFRLSTSDPRRGDLAIYNVRPNPGEPASFFATPGVPVTEDYAMVAVLPGLTAGRRTMILAGTTTFGTQAAVEFVCRTEGVKAIMASLGPQNEAGLFEAVLKVKISKGVPFQSQIVVLHPAH